MTGFQLAVVQGPSSLPMTKQLESVLSSTRWVSTWSPCDPVPEGEVARLPALVASVEAVMLPADLEAFAVAMVRLLEWAETWGRLTLPTDSRERDQARQRLIRAYHDDIGHLPSEFVVLAVKRIRQGYAYQGVPTPADILKTVSADLAEAQRTLIKLRVAADKVRLAPPQVPPPTKEERERVAAMLADLKMQPAVVPATVRRVPGHADDRKPDTDRRTAITNVIAETAGRRRISKPGERLQTAPVAPAGEPA